MTNTEYLRQLERIENLMRITQRVDELRKAVDDALYAFVEDSDIPEQGVQSIKSILYYTMEISYYNGVLECNGIDKSDPIILSGIMLNDGNNPITNHVKIMTELLKTSIRK